ncbi:MAG TPA: radical SAM protein, partial [Nitrospiria bacterium]|nr:radical SAM protein [Nitrospiria bacterium]
DDVITDYSLPAWKAVRYRDLTGQIPFSGWLKYPVTGVFLYKGCRYDCKTCGGSRSGSETVLSRKRLGYKSPKKVGVELNQIQSLFSAPTMIVGDIQQNGRAYQSELLKEIKRIGFRNELAFEFFRPPSADLIREISESVSRFNVEMSPESHNEHIRNVFGRPFGNAELERAIEACLKYGAGRVDLFFMIGLPGQTQSSVLRTIDYCEDLLKRYGHKRTIYPFIAPLAPFIDPGSAIWEDPEKFGYRLFARTLEEHRILMEKAETWKDFLNYETLWMSREKIVESTYQASLRLNRIKQEFGLITDEEAERVDHAGRKAMAYLNDLKSFYRDFDFQGMESEGTGKHDVSFGDGTICFKRELNWPVDESGFRILPIASIIFRSFWRRVVPRSLLSNEKSLPLEGLFNLKKRSLLQNFNVPVERRGER